jgi:hypothetical protein
MDGQHKKKSSATLVGVLRIGLGNIPASAPLVGMVGTGLGKIPIRTCASRNFYIYIVTYCIPVLFCEFCRN